jgi:hypothetical protein
MADQIVKNSSVVGQHKTAQSSNYAPTGIPTYVPKYLVGVTQWVATNQRTENIDRSIWFPLRFVLDAMERIIFQSAPAYITSVAK